jgi:hypothetical protein
MLLTKKRGQLIKISAYAGQGWRTSAQQRYKTWKRKRKLYDKAAQICNWLLTK